MQIAHAVTRALLCQFRPDSSITGQALVAQLLRIIRDYNLEEAHRAITDQAKVDPLIPRIICSKALL